MPGIFVGVNGQWRRVVEIYTGVDNSWREVTSIHGALGTQWRRIYNTPITYTVGIGSINPSPAVVGYSNGTAAGHFNPAGSISPDDSFFRFTVSAISCDSTSFTVVLDAGGGAFPDQITLSEVTFRDAGNVLRVLDPLDATFSSFGLSAGGWTWSVSDPWTNSQLGSSREVTLR